MAFFLRKQLVIHSLIVLFAFCNSAWSDTKSAPDSLQQRCNSLVALPYAYYSPETKFAFGVGAFYSFRSSDCDPAGRPSSIKIALTYTQLNQLIIGLLPELYFKNGKYYFNGFFAFYRYPDKFWGIGNRTPDSAEENYEPNYFRFLCNLQKQIKPELYIGLRYHYEYFKIRKTDDKGVLQNGTILGSRGGSTSGLGVIVNYDTRDHIYYPKKGFYNQIYTVFFNGAIGSDYKFKLLSVDLRRYFSLFDSHVLAFQTYDSFISGDPPFQMLNMFGSSYWMRGYYFGRYRDKHMVTCQMEYRIPLLWRAGAVGFAGLGDVSNNIEKFQMDQFKYCIGFGLRLMFDKKERINARLDVGLGKGGNSGIYAMVLEAF